jgi:hypothetical protein
MSSDRRRARAFNVPIKSGSGDVHGSYYEYIRNAKLDANNFSQTGRAGARALFRQNQYGASIRGPVVISKLYSGCDKTFWFASWEVFGRGRGQPAQSSVPTDALRTGDFSGIER